MLWAYFDESGCHNPKNGRLQRLTFGGCLAPAHAWEGFESEWRAILEPEKVDCFHMADFEAWRPPFNFQLPDGSRDQAKHNRILNELLNAIARRAPWTFGFSRNVTIEGQSLREIYECCAIDTLMHMANSSAYYYGDEISVVFAQHKEFARSNLEGYFRFMNYADARLGTVATDKPKNVCQLQAADLIAYEVSRMERTGVPERYPIRELKRLGCHFRFSTGYP
jgi:hypothetical protein